MLRGKKMAAVLPHKMWLGPGMSQVSGGAVKKPDRQKRQASAEDGDKLGVLAMCALALT